MWLKSIWWPLFSFCFIKSKSMIHYDLVVTFYSKRWHLCILRVILGKVQVPYSWANLSKSHPKHHSLTTWASALCPSAGSWVKQHGTNSLLHTNSKSTCTFPFWLHFLYHTSTSLFLLPVVMSQNHPVKEMRMCVLPQKCKSDSRRSWAFPWQPGLLV